jgi:hypothetical protein
MTQQDYSITDKPETAQSLHSHQKGFDNALVSQNMAFVNPGSVTSAFQKVNDFFSSPVSQVTYYRNKAPVFEGTPEVNYITSLGRKSLDLTGNSPQLISLTPGQALPEGENSILQLIVKHNIDLESVRTKAAAVQKNTPRAPVRKTSSSTARQRAAPASGPQTPYEAISKALQSDMVAHLQKTEENTNLDMNKAFQYYIHTEEGKRAKILNIADFTHQLYDPSVKTVGKRLKKIAFISGGVLLLGAAITLGTLFSTQKKEDKEAKKFEKRMEEGHNSIATELNKSKNENTFIREELKRLEKENTGLKLALQTAKDKSGITAEMTTGDSLFDRFRA